MLFRPPAEHRLEAARNLLDGWNAEADRFRTAAIAALKGEAPTAALVDAMEEARIGLVVLLDDIDGALERVAPGDADFTGLLHAQVCAVALLESIGRSAEIIERFEPDQSVLPMQRLADAAIDGAGAR
jgi:hypothetical protein